MAPVPPPRLRLATGPAGCGKTHLALESIREAATQEAPRGRGATPPGSALLVLPTYAQAERAKRIALTRWQARAVLDEPFATFTSAGERFLPGFRVRALPSAQERDRLAAAALRRAAVPAFAEASARPGFRSRFLRLVKEAKQTGLEPPDAFLRLERGAAALGPAARERLAGFATAAREYQALLAAARLEDHEDALRRLAESLRADPPSRPPRLLVVDGFDDFTAVEDAILEALVGAVAGAGGTVLVTLPWDERRPDLFSASRPARDRLLSRGFVEEELSGFPRAPGGPLAAIAASMFGPPPESARPGGEEVVEIVAGDPEDEAEAVAREARRLVEESGACADAGGRARGWRDVVVIVRALDEAGPRIEAAFHRLQVPVRRVGPSGPIAGEALAAALRGPLRVLAGTDGAGLAHEVLAWVRWVAMATGDGPLLAAVDRTEHAWRADGWPPTWEALRVAAPEPLRPLLDDLDARRLALADARGPEAVWSRIGESLPALAPIPPPSPLDAAGRPTDPAADRRTARAAAALGGLLGLVDDLRTAARRTGLDRDLTGERGVALLLEGAERTAVVLRDTRLDAVSLLDAEEARHWEAPIAIVAGLSEGVFPLRPREDPIVRDADRSVLRAADPALGLPLAAEEEARERRLFYGALTRARWRLVLVRPGRDDAGREREPSLLLKDLRRVVVPSARPPRPPGRAAPPLAEAFTATDLALFAADAYMRGADGERSLAPALLARGDADLLRRARRWRGRGSDTLAGVAEARERFTASVECVSASLLERAVACPRRHFFSEVACVPTDEAPPEGAGFKPTDLGVAIHEALRIAVAEPGRPAREIAEAALASARLLGLDRDLVVGEVARVVDLWRERDAATRGPFAPVEGGLEFEFGRGEGPGPVEFGSGEGRFLLTGRIDRVDRAGGRAVVIDYKTGKSGADSAAKETRARRGLQLPLYALAVERLMGLEVRGLEWVVATRRRRFAIWTEPKGDSAGREEGKRFDRHPEAEFREFIESAAARAGSAVAAARAGAHDRAPVDETACERCDWREVCRPDVEWIAGRMSGDVGVSE